MTIIVTDLTQAIDQIIETFNHHDLVDINVQPDFENMIDKRKKEEAETAQEVVTIQKEEVKDSQKQLPTCLILISKMDNPRAFTDLLPISLSNFSCKIISSLVNRRLNSLMN